MTDLSEFKPSCVKYIKDLTTNARFGLSQAPVTISDGHSSGFSFEEPPNCDHFSVTIPFAGKTIVWEVILNDTEEGPDFIFNHPDFCPEVDTIPGLVEWDEFNPEMLSLVLKELLESFRIFELQKLMFFQYELYTELRTLFSEHICSERDVEVYFSNQSQKRSESIDLLINLPIDYSTLPPYKAESLVGEDTRTLISLTYLMPEVKLTRSQLLLTDALEKVIGRISASFSVTQEKLSDHVSQWNQTVKNHIAGLNESCSKRKDYIEAMVSCFGDSVQEYDSSLFNRISLMFEWRDFFFTLHVELSENFPQEQPRFTFQSVYHLDSSNKPFHEVVTDYPYSPRWSAEEMASRIRTFLADYIGGFQRNSVIHGSSL